MGSRVLYKIVFAAREYFFATDHRDSCRVAQPFLLALSLPNGAVFLVLVAQPFLLALSLPNGAVFSVLVAQPFLAVFLVLVAQPFLAVFFLVTNF